MSEERERGVREFVDAFNSRDVDAIVELTSPDCEIVALRSEIEGPFRGHHGVRLWMEDYLDTVPDARLIAERIEPLGAGGALVLGRQTGTAPIGGASWDAPLAAIAEYEDGLLKRLTAYESHAAALEAAGR